MVHDANVVDDLDDVVRSFRVEDLRFGGEEVLERALPSFEDGRERVGASFLIDFDRDTEVSRVVPGAFFEPIAIGEERHV